VLDVYKARRLWKQALRIADLMSEALHDAAARRTLGSFQGGRREPAEMALTVRLGPTRAATLRT
jgi:hypothetical protein